jgi:hypothetical protein
MTRRDDSQWSGPGPSRRRPGSAGRDDVLEQGSREPPGRPPRIAILLGVAGLVIGLAVGYVAGHQQGSHTAVAARTPSAAASVSSPARMGAMSPEDGPPLGGPDSLVQSGSQCATQPGRHRLQLGVQVTNQSARPVTLMQITADEPLGGLRMATHTWGTCAELPFAQSEPGRVVAPGASTWFTVTFRVLVKCPGALPVQFSVRFFQHGRTFTAELPGFVDLGHVPYQGCPVSG